MPEADLPQTASPIVGIQSPARLQSGVGTVRVRSEEKASAMVESPMIGRSEQLDTLLGLLEAVADGPRRVAVVEGEAGIGKSRLLAAALDAALARGFRVLTAKARELEQSVPFAALADALDVRKPLEVAERAEVARLLFGEPGSAGPPVALVDASQQRLRLLEAVVSLVEKYSLEKPVVLAIEDLHWADSASLLGFEFLARRLFAQPILLVATLRPVPLRGELDRAVDALLAEGGLHLELGPLTGDEVAALAEWAVGAPPTARLLSVAEAAGGNPLFLTELVSTLRSGNAIEISGGRADIRQRLLPPPLRLLVLKQLAGLPADTLDVLRVASILGSVFSVTDLSAVLDRPTTALMQSLVEARRARFLGDAGDDLAFRHELVRDAIYYDLPPPVRRALHLQAGRALADRAAAPALVASHLSRSASSGDSQAVQWLRRAGSDALQGAPSVAVDLFGRARELTARSNPEYAVVTAELVAALAWSGLLDDAETVAGEVLGQPGQGDAEKSMRIVLAEAMVARGRVWDARREMDRLLEHLSDCDPERGRALAFGAWTRIFTGDLSGALARCDLALAAADEAGDEGARAAALCGKSITALFCGDMQGAVQQGREAIRRTIADPTRHLDRYPAQLFLGMALFESDAADEADQTLREGLRHSEDMGLALHAPFYHAELGLQGFFTGRWDDASAELEVAIAAAGDQQPGAAILARSVLAIIAIHRDQLGIAEDLIVAAEVEHDRTGAALGLDTLRWARGLLGEATGDGSGVDALTKAWEHPEAKSATELVRVGPDVIRLALASGSIELASSVVAVVGKAADRNPAQVWRAAALRSRGLHGDEPDALLESATLYRLGARPVERALVSEDAATLLGELGRADEAILLLTDAMTIHQGLDAARGLARTRAALRRLGVRSGRRTPHRMHRTGWDSLTNTEHDVVRLATKGLTNAEIGRRLFISRRTVETHLAHIFAKLALRSRVQLAAAATLRQRNEPA